MIEQIARQIVDAVNRSRCEWAPSGTDPVADAAAFVAYLRGRHTPRTGYTPAYVEEVRRLAPEAARHDARDRLEQALGEPVVEKSHGNPVIRCGAENLILAMDTSMAERLGQAVLDGRE